MNKLISFCAKQLKNLLEILLLISLAVLVRSVLYEPYVVPSTSMLPTLLVGDRILVQKFSYGISRHSFPFSPDLFKGRVLEFSKPARGDVVVFETDKVYVKRLIGLPGDTVQMIDGRLFLNGKEVSTQTVSAIFSYQDMHARQYVEELPGGVKHKTLELSSRSHFDNTKAFKVPEGHYFFMGDNRDQSNDSRGTIGFVPYENLLGKVKTIFFSSEEIRWYNPMFLFDMKTDRFFKKID